MWCSSGSRCGARWTDAVWTLWRAQKSLYLPQIEIDRPAHGHYRLSYPCLFLLLTNHVSQGGPNCRFRDCFCGPRTLMQKISTVIRALLGRCDMHDIVCSSSAMCEIAVTHDYNRAGQHAALGESICGLQSLKQFL
jgi:hypothetical protein